MIRTCFVKNVSFPKYNKKKIMFFSIFFIIALQHGGTYPPNVNSTIEIEEIPSSIVNTICTIILSITAIAVISFAISHHFCSDDKSTNPLATDKR